MNAECYFGGSFNKYFWYSRKEIRRKCKEDARECGDDHIIIHFSDGSKEYYERHGTRWYQHEYDNPLERMVKSRRVME